MTDPERFNLRLYEKDGIQFRTAQVTVLNTAREICDSAQEKWFKGWQHIEVCLGEQRGSGPVRPVDPAERPGETMARYSGATDEIKYYLVVRPLLVPADREPSPRSATSSTRVPGEQRESPEAFSGLARRMSVLRATSFSISKARGSNPGPAPTPASNAKPPSPPSPSPAPTPSPAPFASTRSPAPSNSIPLNRPFSSASLAPQVIANTNAVYGTLIVGAPTSAAAAPAPVPAARAIDKRKDTATGLADIRSKIEAIRARNEEEKRKIDQRIAEEEEEKRRAEELTRKFEEEIEAMRRGDAERRAAAAQSMAGFRKAERPPSERPDARPDTLIGRRAVGDTRPFSADGASVNQSRTSSQLGNISRPPPPRPANATAGLLPVVGTPPRTGGGIKIAVRPNPNSATPALSSPLAVSPPSSSLASAALPSSAAATAATSTASNANTTNNFSSDTTRGGSFVSASSRRRSGSMPVFDRNAFAEDGTTPKLLVTPSKPPTLPPPPTLASPRSSGTPGLTLPTSLPPPPAVHPRSESPRSPRSMSLLSGQHRMTAGSRDSSPSEPAIRKAFPSPPRTSSSSSEDGERTAIVPEDDELTQDEAEVLALEEEFEEMRLAQLPPTTEAEQQAFVSMRPSDIVFIGTLAEGRLAPGMPFYGIPFYIRHAVCNGQEVVVKRIATAVPAEVLAERFGWVKNLRHVNIAPSVGICLLSDSGDGQLAGVYSVTEYQAGGTLRQLLSSSSLALPWKLRLAMVVDVAKALLYLHTKRITHGAIRSSSVLVDLNGRLRLSDVGLARRFSDAPRADDSRYAAPEALLSAVFTPQGDSFSFGVLLWEIVHRKDAPFRRADDSYSAEALLEWPMPAGAMPELQVLLARCLADDPASRPSFEDIVPRVRAMAVTVK